METRSIIGSVEKPDETETIPLPQMEEPIDASISTTAFHIARFEFSDQGTKVLMVEWLAAQESDVQRTIDNSTKQLTSGWEISWSDKNTFLPANDDDDVDRSCRRVYFLLPPDASIPNTISIKRPNGTSLMVKPLPAIFPDGFEAESGPRGVLHTIWAKKRLRELDREIELEMKSNAESVGVDMALAEKRWIMDNFVRAPSPPSQVDPVLMAPVSRVKSPPMGRLGEKLRGLKLGTSPAELTPSPIGTFTNQGDNLSESRRTQLIPDETANTFANAQSFSLSPQGTDVAVPSVFTIPNRSACGGISSLDAMVSGNNDSGTRVADGNDKDEGLFALPMSPRSPDMKKSPFSVLS